MFFLLNSVGLLFLLLLVSASWWVCLVQGLLQASWWEGLVPAHWWVEQGLIPQLGRAVSRGIFRGGAGLRVALLRLSAMHRSVFPPCWLCGLRHPSTGSCRMLGGARPQCQSNDLCESSQGWIYSRTSANTVFAPWWATANYFLPRRPIVRSTSVSYGVTVLPWVPVHMKPCCILQEWKLLVVTNLWPSNRMLWGLFLWCHTPDSRAWYGAQNSHSYGRISVI